MDEIKELVNKRLQCLGLGLQDEDYIEIYIENATSLLLSHLNESELPDGTDYLLSEIATGMLLSEKLIMEEKSNGAISSIKEGNISLSYSNGKSLLDIAHDMCRITEYKLSPFRGIKW